MTPESDFRLHFPATARNREPILAVLERVLPARGTVLEIGSGSGEHAARFAPHFPGLVWQPSDVDRRYLPSIAAWAAAAGTDNILPPLEIDVRAPDWGPDAEAAAPRAAILAINVVHISPWAASEGLVAGASRLLDQGGVLYLYGPFKREGRHTADSNRRFDAQLRAENPDWGVRDVEDVAALAEAHGLALADVVAMPANNLSIVFRRG